MGVKFVDLFCGAGGASAGFVAAGLECVLAIDFDPVALASHKANHPGAEHVLVDMTRPGIRWERLRGEVDLVHGSPPCQNLSSANRAKDQDQALVTLRAFEETVDAIRPQWFTMENVPLVKPHLNGLYRKVRLFNCADFGVPQTRSRVFAGVFPDPRPTHTRNGPQETLTGGLLERWISLGEALQLEGYVNTGRDWKGPEEQQERGSDEPAPTFSAKAPSQWKFVDKCYSKVRNGPSVHSADRPATTITTAASRMEVIPPGPPLPEKSLKRMQRFVDDYHNGKLRPLDPGQPSRTITTRNAFQQTNDGLWIQTEDEDGALLVSKNTWGGKKGSRYSRRGDEPSFTLTTHQGGVKLFPGGSDEPSAPLDASPPTIRSRDAGRQLSEQECAALQSFPPGYVFLGNKTQRQRQIGNAVPPKMAEAIGRAIMEEYGDK